MVPHGAGSKGGGYKRGIRVARDIQRVLSSAMGVRVRDPRLEGVVITEVKITDDLKLATVHWYLLEGKNELHAREAEGGFEKAKGMLRHLVGEELNLRATPELRFYYDTGVDNLRRIEELLHEARQQAANSEAAPIVVIPEAREE